MDSLSLEDGELPKNRVVLPGDEIDCPAASSSTIILGPGIRRVGDTLVASRCGILRTKQKPPTYWLDTHSKRYVAVKGDRVIGIIVGKMGESWKVDIGCADYAQINFLSFEGVTKRTKPNLKSGDIIYCQVLVATKDMEAEVVCIDGEGKARGLGVLSEPGGLLVRVSLNLIRRLLQPDGRLLALLGEHIKFETTCGMNGRLWVRAPDSLADAVTVANTIVDAEYVIDDAAGGDAMLARLVRDNMAAMRARAA